MEVYEVLVRGCGVCQCPLFLELEWCGLRFSETWSYFQRATLKKTMQWEWRCCGTVMTRIAVNDNYPEIVASPPMRHVLL
jgi:hypothetical protein